MEKYQDLAFEIRRIHGAKKVTVIPIVIGALGSISKRAKTWYDKLQSRTKLVGTLELYHVSPIPPNQCWKISLFSNKKGKNHPIINIESGGRGELTSCPNTFVWDCLKEEFKECHAICSSKGWK